MISSQLTFAHPISVQTYRQTNEAHRPNQITHTNRQMKHTDRIKLHIQINK